MQRSTINDYDVFSPDPHRLIKLLKKAIGYTTFECDHFTNFNIADKKVQVITRFAPESPEAIFRTFDFTICSAAYDGQEFFCHDRFWQDIATRRLVIEQLNFLLKTLERVAKYAGRGYTACPVGLLNLAKAIHGLTIDWNNPDENSLTFYTDGTPRFTGVD